MIKPMLTCQPCKILTSFQGGCSCHFSWWSGPHCDSNHSEMIGVVGMQVSKDQCCLYSVSDEVSCSIQLCNVDQVVSDNPIVGVDWGRVPLYCEIG